MAIQTYTLNAGRVNEIKGEILGHAIPVEVLALGCEMEKMPKNQGDNITYRRWLPRGATTTSANTINRWTVTAADHLLAEGVAPAVDSITPHDVNVQIQQYGAIYGYTDKAEDLYEDDIPAAQKEQLGERMGLLREMIRYGALRACTNAFYSGGTTRATVDGIITLDFLRLMAQGLMANHAKMKNRVLSASADYDTSAIEAGYLVFAHTDLEPDIRDIPGFVPTAKYGQRKVINEHEIGGVERFRFITSPDLGAYADAGAAIAGTDLFSTTGTSADVYPVLVMGKEACYDIALRGSKSFDISILPPSQKEKSDILGQRGYVGGKFYAAALVVNNGWMAVGEVARTDLSN